MSRIELHPIKDSIIIEDSRIYDPEESGDKDKVKEEVKSYVDKIIDLITDNRIFNDSYVVVSKSYNELEKVVGPAFDEFINHIEKKYYIRYMRSIEFL